MASSEMTDHQKLRVRFGLGLDPFWLAVLLFLVFDYSRASAWLTWLFTVYKAGPPT